MVVAAIGGAYALGEWAAFELPPEGVLGSDWFPVVVLVLAASVAYLVGGAVGRAVHGGVDLAERRLRRVPTGELLAGAIGAVAGFLLTLAVVWPVLLFEGRVVTVPLAVLVAVVLTSAGARIGRARGGDFLRFMGVPGRLRVSSPAHGGGVKLVDSSALVDGRLLDVCRAGFVEGTLVVPRFVLAEVQGLADAGDEQRRTRGKRALDVLAALQRSAGVALEVPDDDYPEVADVDAKLLAMARDIDAALVTVDGNLGRVAEVQGIRVLNLHTLAETLRPPVLVGDTVRLRLTRPGREPGQGVGHLDDGTMVVVEGGAAHVEDDVQAEITSVLSTANGRMLFARLGEDR
ncbi:MAG TPA: TRAM domain-containing protein [Egibacteraceae bacterium]|nr:TRAM domain-containing protein [Egibacteraceae bacterium]